MRASRRLQQARIHGPRPRYILTTPHRLTAEEAEQLKSNFLAAVKGKQAVTVIDSGVRVETIYPTRRLAVSPRHWRLGRWRWQ